MDNPNGLVNCFVSPFDVDCRCILFIIDLTHTGSNRIARTMMSTPVNPMANAVYIFSVKYCSKMGIAKTEQIIPMISVTRS